MYLLVVFLPLLGSLVSGFFGRYIGKQGAIIISTSLLFLSAFISFFIFYEVVLCHSVCTIKLFPWMESNSLFLSWGFLFDGLTATMLIVVTFISSLVHLYSSEYMSEDPHLPRFMSYLSLFTFFMLMLVTADNYVQMFLGWEGVGLASYLLINFWHTRILANKAAMKALIMNRIGDFGLALGISLIYFSFYSFDFSVVFSLSNIVANETFIFFNYEFNKILVISVLLFLGAVGKSAQIGLHTWLPDAMEGPTPVSALIHAATMVTAGVFVVLRSSPLLEFSNTALIIITIMGALTAFMAATIGVVQNDLKKVIAYSTCSQLGYMIFACGLSNYSISLFHLMNHAFFKALLFLSAGSIIHAMADEQDMRRMGGLVKLLPVSYIMVFIGSLSLMGFPFLTGFYSKDILLELTYGSYYFNGFFAYWLGSLSAFLTSFYSIRLLYLTFLAPTASSKDIIMHVHEAPTRMLIPLVVLCVASIFVGFILKDLFLGLGTDTWNGVLFQLPEHVFYFESEFLPFFIKLIPVILSLSGAFSAYFCYSYFYNYFNQIDIYKKFYNVYYFFVHKWYFDNVYNYFIVNNLFIFGYHVSFKLLDRGLIELLGPLGFVRMFNNFSSKISELHSGLIYHYAFTLVLGSLFFVFLLFLPFYLKTGFLIVFIYFILYS